MLSLRLLFIALIASTLLGGCSTTHNFTSDSVVKGMVDDTNITEQKKWELMTGNWYGKQKLTDGKIQEWMIHHFGNGVYIIEFKFTDKQGRITYQKETGLWGVSGTIYFTTFDGWIIDDVLKKVRNVDESTREAFEILSLARNKMTYRFLENGDVFTTVRVPDSFKF